MICLRHRLGEGDDEGQLFAAPLESHFLVYDVVSERASGHATKVCCNPRVKQKFRGVAYGKGKVFCAPFDSDKMLIYEVASKKVSGVDVRSVCSGTSRTPSSFR